MVNLTNVTNVTFDNIKFDYNTNSDTSKPFFFNGTKGISIVNSEIDGMLTGGYGSGHGLWVKESSGLPGREHRHLRTSPRPWRAFAIVDDLKVIGNTFDGMRRGCDASSPASTGRSSKATRSRWKGEPGNRHRDMIQFWNNDTNDTSRDIVIRGNTLERGRDDDPRHLHGERRRARVTGDLDDFYRNITIENNTIKSGQVFGIVVGEAVGVKIRNNTVLQHSAIDSSRPSTFP